ncbi:integral membrane protein-like protein [Massarina eburnea CBS 473.64]|uniref:Integral membrane protein-like protein n=1 Tax=Massarina eburnea CBS 473.64 TaxID=1395130 RepID=A0A6A6RJ52_9PLEO|nr:integral membrane protein-like protein [Massarina eburnea CBS 473.64]
MRPLAILPALCCTVALILSFLILFAGHKQSFMEDYHILTLNTSRLGESLVNTSMSSSSNPLSSLWDLIPSNIQGDVQQAAGAVTEQLGIEDFYSAHLLDYCYGQYTPTEAPNATISGKDIHKNVTGCSNQTAMFWFDPKEILDQALDKSGLPITLDDLKWPDDIQTGLNALRLVSVTSFVLYCISVALIFVALVAAIPAIFTEGRLFPCLNLLVSILAFLAIGLASSLVTALIVKGSEVINQYGNDIGVEAKKGEKFLALTWAATALVFITMIVWSVQTCCCGRRKQQKFEPAKHG